jgi:hypothetical protein
MRDHKPTVIDQFNGLWRRGDFDSTPPDHFSDCNNIQYIQGGFKTRDGIDTHLAYPTVLRMYTFNQESGQSLLILDNAGNIYDSGSTTPLTPILTVTGMTDFGFVPFAGRAYISPSDGVTGLENEFVYVYEGDGTVARKAGGVSPVDADGLLAAANSGVSGNVEPGIHIYAAVYETESGFLTNMGPDTLPVLTTPGGFSVDLSNIPVSTDPAVTTVHILSTKGINPLLYSGDPRSYEFFFIPGADVPNGTLTKTVSYFDADLLDSADDLEDLFEEIPAGVGLGVYHNRLLVYTTFNDISLVYVSNVGEPEAINQIDGLLIFPLDGEPITNAQEFRDVLYVFKQKRTNAWSDNGDSPSSWPLTILDQGIGCSLHGLSTVLDSGGVNVDFLITSDYAGIYLFNGTFVKPELSWKIKDLWLALDRDKFNYIRAINDTVKQILYFLLPDFRILMGDYSNGLEPKPIRWATWTFDVQATDLALVETNTLVIGVLGLIEVEDVSI